MRAVVQRVISSSVEVDGKVISSIEKGFLVLIGVEKGDTEKDSIYIASKISGLRVFEDENDKMNLSLNDIDGSILLVSQFTLIGDVRKGRRPSFSNAEFPEIAKITCEYVGELLEKDGIRVMQGVFGADMKVSLVNDGPVTILLDSKRTF